MQVPGEHLSTERCEKLIHGARLNWQAGENPRLNLSNFNRLDLGALMNLVGFCAAAKAGRLDATRLPVAFPMDLPDDTRARAYLFQTRFFKFAEFAGGLGQIIEGAIELAKEEERQNAGRFGGLRYPFMPFQLVVRSMEGCTQLDFEMDCGRFLEQLNDKFNFALTTHLGFPVREAEDFWLPNKEIIENIFKHSKSWGAGAIQCFRDSVLICYGDIGIGIQTTLEPYRDKIVEVLRREWSDCTAIQAAFTRGITSLPGKSRGVGLDDVKAYVRKCNGAIECRSGSGKVVFYGNGGARDFAVDYIPGVQFRIWLPAFKATRT